VKRFIAVAALSFALLFGTFALPASAGDCPRYLVLNPMYGGQATPVQAHAYAYGWFGEVHSSASTWHRTYDGTGLWWTFTPAW
jgi:hypothetical protein